MTLTEARAVKLHFGKYKNRTVGEVESADLLYLDWALDANCLTREQRNALFVVCEARSADINRLVEERE